MMTKRSGSAISITPFFRDSFKFRCKPSLLGAATKLHERMYYTKRKVLCRRDQKSSSTCTISWSTTRRMATSSARPISRPSRSSSRSRRHEAAGIQHHNDGRPDALRRPGRRPSLGAHARLRQAQHTRPPALRDRLAAHRSHVRPCRAALRRRARAPADPALENSFIQAQARYATQRAAMQELNALAKEMARLLASWNKRCGKSLSHSYVAMAGGASNAASVKKKEPSFTGADKKTTRTATRTTSTCRSASSASAPGARKTAPPTPWLAISGSAPSPSTATCPPGTSSRPARCTTCRATAPRCAGPRPLLQRMAAVAAAARLCS